MIDMHVKGSAELPLHTGHVPPGLLQYMKKLGRAIALYIIDVFGPDKLIERLSDPLWFQAFNNVIGMDWDSSGSTTVVLYVLKDFANVYTFNDLGIAVLGGKGIDSRYILDEADILDRSGDVDVDNLKYISMLSAKIDSAALQDGYSLYIHSIILSRNNTWTVIQQGMNTDLKMARRYHIYNMVTAETDPHSGIACNSIGKALNLVDHSSKSIRRTIIDLINSASPSILVRKIAEINRMLKNNLSLESWISKGNSLHNLSSIKDVDPMENPLLYKPIININRIERALHVLSDIKPSSFEELLILKGVGAETMRALALIANLVYGEEPSSKDPVTHPLDPFIYSYAHGGKDGVPYPIKLSVMRETIAFLEEAIAEARIDIKIKRKALERLHKLFNMGIAENTTHFS
uniref:DUF763 domain-containing protein n=1 Tax=Ignisphaera aggregans TaxID=334771 RepID=A0A7J3IA14_9CREN